MTDANEASLQAYHDGELGWWAQWRFEAHLRRSSELRAELEAIRSLGSALRTAEETSLADAPDLNLWPAIAAELPNARSAGGTSGLASDSAAGSWAGWFTWRPVATGATGALAIAAATAFFALQPGPPVQPADAGGPMTATVRYLDTGGRTVLLDGGEDFTIIWLTPGDAV